MEYVVRVQSSRYFLPVQYLTSIAFLAQVRERVSDPLFSQAEIPFHHCKLYYDRTKSSEVSI